MAHCDAQRNIAWAEALRPHDKDDDRDDTRGACVELPGVSAIAKSHGIHTPWHAIFRRGRNICNTGGDGRVYQAKTLKGNKPVVLKFVYGARDDIDKTEKIFREVTILGMFDHPNIVRMLGTFSAPLDAHFAFVQALEEADTDLHALLSRRPEGQLSDPVARIAACQIAAGLSCIHRASVLHRDIKSSNILVYLDHHPSRYVVADFGRARVMPIPERAQRMSRKTAVSCAAVSLHAVAAQTRGLGTPMYDAPELLLPPGTLDAHAGLGNLDASYGFGVDTWAFGCVVFEMVTGRPFVFEGTNDRFSAIVARLGDPPSMPSTLTAVAPMQGVSSLEGVLTDRDPLLIHFLQDALRWVPSHRKTVVDLCRSQWLDRPMQNRSADRPMQLPTAESLGGQADAESLGGQPDAESLGGAGFDMSSVPTPPPIT